MDIIVNPFPNIPVNTGPNLPADATVLASSLAYSRLEIFDKIFAERLAAIDTVSALVYMIDTVSSSALPILARQLDVDGFKGYALCTTDTQRRELIKNSIELHKYKGTPFGVKRALQSIGMEGAEILEGGGYFCDGSIFNDGSILCGDSDWATFQIIYDLGETLGFDSTAAENYLKLVEEYKPARCKLVGASFEISVNDTVSVTDSGTELFDYSITIDADDNGSSFFINCSGDYFCNGDRDCSGETDDVEWELVY